MEGNSGESPSFMKTRRRGLGGEDYWRIPSDFWNLVTGARARSRTLARCHARSLAVGAELLLGCEFLMRGERADNEGDSEEGRDDEKQLKE